MDNNQCWSYKVRRSMKKMLYILEESFIKESTKKVMENCFCRCNKNIYSRRQEDECKRRHINNYGSYAY